jgi:signal transduction histidine kinase
VLDAQLATAKILIVDDEQPNVRLLERLLRQAGFAHLDATTNSREVISRVLAFEPDLILLDLRMPHPDGFEIMAELTRQAPPQNYRPILVLTADVTREATRRALEAGANDFLTKPFDYQEVLLRIRNLLLTRFLYLETMRHAAELEERVQERTRRLLQAEKLSVMSQLVAGVAHELNNPLSVVTGQAALLQDARLEAPFGGRVDKIAKASERCVRIVRSFLALAREQAPERQAVDLNAVVRDAVDLMAYELRADGIEVTVDLGTGLPTFSADPQQLHQVLINLMANAQHSMRRSPPPRVLTVTTRLGAPGRLRLEVADTGAGISAEVRDRIFEPFFTTKPTGQGTGLGLSLSRGMIEEHGGTISVESEPEGGAVFTVDLPAEPPGALPRAGAGTAQDRPVSAQRVLVVDDEPDVAGVLVDMLALDGHEVEIALNGAEALDLVAARAFDIVLSDTKMPVLDGISFYQELLRLKPEYRGRVAFVTGDALSPDKREFFETAGVPSVTKPFSMDEIRRVVQQLAIS